VRSAAAPSVDHAGVVALEREDVEQRPGRVDLVVDDQHAPAPTVDRGRVGRSLRGLGPGGAARQIDGEHAALARQVVDVDLPAVGLDPLAADGQPEAHPGAIAAALLERGNRPSALPGGRPPHSSSISKTTRSAVTRVRRAT
jgi:hypothetical protein